VLSDKQSNYKEIPFLLWKRHAIYISLRSSASASPSLISKQQEDHFPGTKHGASDTALSFQDFWVFNSNTWVAGTEMRQLASVLKCAWILCI